MNLKFRLLDLGNRANQTVLPKINLNNASSDRNNEIDKNEPIVAEFIGGIIKRKQYF